LRQDTANRKVYLLEPFSGQDTLLYDFDLALGDTLPPAYNNYIQDNVVSNIDSVLVGNQYHRRFWLSAAGTADYTAIIEGIGSTFGLTFPLFPPFEFFNTLLCVTVNGNPVYPDTSTACPLISGLAGTIEHAVFSISPMPFTDESVLSCEHTGGDGSAVLFDLSGIPVARYEVKSGRALLQRGELPSGFYLLKVEGPRRVYFSKIIIQ
jgi:hypothetical protein